MVGSYFDFNHKSSNHCINVSILTLTRILMDEKSVFVDVRSGVLMLF